jgi:hypothetical protein
MTLYKRKWDCAVCGEPVYYDTDTNTLSCGCGQRKTTPKEIGLTVNFIPVTFQPTTAIEKAKQTQEQERKKRAIGIPTKQRIETIIIKGIKDVDITYDHIRDMIIIAYDNAEYNVNIYHPTKASITKI